MYRHMRTQKPQANIQRNQQGIVSIVVTIILMIILTLIVLSFAKISRREGRNALDRQLSTQAFYAAESGINDARKVLKAWVTSSDPKIKTDYMDDCTAFAAAASPSITLPGVLSGSGAASYTCLFVDPSPPTIKYVKSDAQHIFPLEDAGGTPLNTMEIYWDDGSGGSNFAGCPAPKTNPTVLPAANCHAPVLRLELVDASAPATLTTSKVFFLYPSSSSGGTLDYSGSATGSTAQANCSAGAPQEQCKIQITGMPALKYYVRIKNIYRPAVLTITANNGAAQLIGAQALIDATGKATDVERRIQVRVQANDLAGNIPLYGLQATDRICKKFSVDGTTVTDNGSCWAGGGPN